MVGKPSVQIDPADAVRLRNLHDALCGWGSNLDGAFRFPNSANIREAVDAAERKVRENWAGLSDSFRATHPGVVSEWSSFERGDVVGTFYEAIRELVDSLPPA